MSSLTANMNFAEILKKAEEGDLDAMYDAVLYMAAEGYTGKDAEPEINGRYMAYLQKLVQSGNKTCLILLATAYRNGEIVEADPQEAIRLYELAAEKGIRFGNECIGMMYYEGTAAGKDYEKAYAYFRKNRGKKSFCTLYALGEMYRLGLYVKKNLKKACEYYSRIAYDESNSADIDDYYWRAQYRLACAKHCGRGTAKDLEEALRLIGSAKKLGRTEDEVIPGEGITEEAILQEWLQISRELGNI